MTSGLLTNPTRPGSLSVGFLQVRSTDGSSDVTSVSDILTELRATASDNRDLGDRFERLMVAYLQTDPLYADRYSNVWRWVDWPDRGVETDTGIDLVAEERLSLIHI